MKDSEICIEAIREYLIRQDDDGFEKESVDLAYHGTVKEIGPEPIKNVIMVEGKMKTFGGYKTWIELDKYKEIARDFKIRNLL